MDNITAIKYLDRKGFSDAQIIRCLRIDSKSLRAYRAHITRNAEKSGRAGDLESRTEEDPVRDAVIALKEKGVPNEEIYGHPSLKGLKGADKYSIRAYLAHHGRGSYNHIDRKA